MHINYNHKNLKQAYLSQQGYLRSYSFCIFFLSSNLVGSYADSSLADMASHGISEYMWLCGDLGLIWGNVPFITAPSKAALSRRKTRYPATTAVFASTIKNSLYYPGTFLGGLRRASKNLSQDSRCPG
jgi:hypothetical protein